MKLSKRVVAVILSMCMAFTPSAVGAEVRTQMEQDVQTNTQEEQGHQAKGQNEKANGQEEQDLPIETQEGEGKPQEGQDARTAPQALIGTLKFIMLEQDTVKTPGTQNVAVGLGAEGCALAKASIQYVNTKTGEEFTAEAVEVSDDMARFSMQYDKESQAGVYEITGVSYETDGNVYQVDLAKLDMKVIYGVEEEVEAEPDDLILDQDLLSEVGANVVTLDEDGNTASQTSMEDVLSSAGARSRSTGVRGAKDMVIILDPGHDSTHAGASYYGYQEQDLVLKIATYCKEELQKYTGISVYMTRETVNCAFGGKGTDSATCNAKRVEFAASKGADVYVSFHLNASTGNANGVGVYYPNSSYRSDIGQEGKELAASIYRKLAALGLSTWAGGILIRNSENNTRYPDGSLADYLAVIRRSKLAGFPAVLIEHAFLSSATDVEKFLNTDAKLKKLGVSDAQGIAGYYNLSLKGSTPVISYVQSRDSHCLRVKWEKTAEDASYEVYRSNAKSGEYSLLAKVTADKYDDKTAQPGETYYYKVRAVYADGEISKYSKAASGKALTQPKIASVVSAEGGALKVSWTQVIGASKYELLRGETKDGEYQKIATLSGEESNLYLDSGVKTQKTYYYKVRARGGEKNGYGDYSEPLSGWAIKSTKIYGVSSKDSTSLEITWKKVSKAYAYKIKRSTKKTKGYKTLATVDAESLSYLDKERKPGTTYYYKIQAINKVNGKKGVSSFCKAASGKTILPTSIEYVKSKNSSSMEIKWKKDPNAYAYRVKRSLKANGTFEQVADVVGCKNTKYVDKSITSGKKYYYAVETITDKKGVKNYSGNSKAVSARNLKKVSIGSSQVDGSEVILSWGKISGANGYQVRRSTSKGGPYKTIAKIKGGSSLTYTDCSAESGRRYYYKIRAVKTGKYTGYGSYSKVLEKWIQEAPKGVSVKSQQPDSIQLTWKKKSGASGYEILRSTKKDSGYKVIGKLTGEKKTTYTDQAVLPEKTYYYKVAATVTKGKASGRGDLSAAAVGATKIGKGGIAKIHTSQEGFLVLQLEEIPGADGYEIQRSLKEDGGFVSIGKLEGIEDVFTDRDVQPGTTYYYRARTIVRAGDTDYYSGYSDVTGGRMDAKG